MVVFWLYRIALSGIYKTIFLNNADLEIFISNKLVRDSNAKLLNGEGVNLEYFSTNFPVAQSDRITFLLVARMLWDKGVGEYVEAAKKVKEKFPNAVFQLLGPIDAQNPTSIPHSQIDNWMRDELVDYLGVHDDVRPFIASADCRVLMEACSMGRPIIATNVPGCSEIVEDGITGFLCKPRDPIDLEEKIQMMMHLSSSDRLLMGKRAVKRAADLFDENIINSKFIEFIEC
jgi:glycosyltransferase involved in cell wall biosynthesis